MNKLVHLDGLEAAEFLRISDDIWRRGFYGKKMSSKGAAIFLEALARDQYKDEQRRDRTPKINHMAEAAMPFNRDIEDHYVRRAIGWGHDLIEEKPELSLKLLQSWGVTDRILKGISDMTRPIYDSYIGPYGKLVEIHEPYLDAFRKLMRNPDAAAVKLEGDLPSNMHGHTNGNKIYVYQIAMAYGIGCSEGIFTLDFSYQDFFKMMDFGETGNKKLDEAIAVVKKIPTGTLKQVLSDECSEYNGRAKDITNYFNPLLTAEIPPIAEIPAAKPLSFYRRLGSGQMTSNIVVFVGRVGHSARQAFKTAAGFLF